MPLSPWRTSALAALSALGLTLAACDGASSDDAAPTAAADSIDVEESSGLTGALGEMALGDPAAKVTIVEYASVTCPHCAAFHENIFPAIKKNYIDTGKVRFVFREFPTAPTSIAVAGSMIARCAADKGGLDAYFLVLDALFKTQDTWIYQGDTRTELIKIASQAGMDEDAFDACLNRQELIDLINKNIREGREEYEINSTPSFVINGQTRHFSTVEDASKVIDEALKSAEDEDA
jgi:protein-disulfide isomerase